MYIFFRFIWAYSSIFVTFAYKTNDDDQVAKKKAQFAWIWYTKPQRLLFCAARATRRIALLRLCHAREDGEGIQYLHTVLPGGYKQIAVPLSQPCTSRDDSRGRSRPLNLRHGYGLSIGLEHSYHSIPYGCLRHAALTEGTSPNQTKKSR